MLRLVFWILLLAVNVAVIGFAVGVNMGRQETGREAEREYYRGVYSLCVGVVLPTREACLDLISRAYAENFWQMPDEGWVFPPPSQSPRD